MHMPRLHLVRPVRGLEQRNEGGGDGWRVLRTVSQRRLQCRRSVNPQGAVPRRTLPI
jgi:hypothetical protein